MALECFPKEVLVKRRFLKKEDNQENMSLNPEQQIFAKKQFN